MSFPHKDLLFVIEPDGLWWESISHCDTKKPPEDTPQTRLYPVYTHQTTNGWIPLIIHEQPQTTDPPLSPPSASASSSSFSTKTTPPDEKSTIWFKPNWDVILDFLSLKKSVHLAIYSRLSEGLIRFIFEFLFHHVSTSHLVYRPEAYNPLEFVFVWGSSRNILCGASLDSFMYQPHPFLIFKKYPLWKEEQMYFFYAAHSFSKPDVTSFLPASLASRFVFLEPTKKITDYVNISPLQNKNKELMVHLQSKLTDLQKLFQSIQNI